MKKHERAAMRLRVYMWHKACDEVGRDNVKEIEGRIYAGYYNYMMWVVLASIRSGDGHV